MKNLGKVVAYNNRKGNIHSGDPLFCKHPSCRKTISEYRKALKIVDLTEELLMNTIKAIKGGI